MDKQQEIHSISAIQRMIEKMDERYGNAIHNISIIDFDKATQADFINGIDATMTDCTGNSHRLQFKSRMTSTDICLELAPIPRQTNLSYYSTRHNKYLILDTKSADIHIQEVSDGTTFIYTSLQLHTLTQYPQFWDNPIHRNKEGQYLLFIPADSFTDMLTQITLGISTGWAL
jgi:hypothetical protein